MRTTTALAFAVLVLSGCTIGKDYTRPQVEMPQAWRIDYAHAADVVNTKWWEQFNDPVLNTLVDDALRENLDIRIAAARVDQFIGALTATRSQMYPQLGYGADMSRTRASRIGQPPIPAGADAYFSLNQMAVSAAWQLDLFGRVQRLSEAAQAQVYASEQAQRGVVLSLVSSVATSYIALRALRWPDAFPAGDVALRKALGVASAGAAEVRARSWQPWRGYAVLRAWQGYFDSTGR